MACWLSCVCLSVWAGWPGVGCLACWHAGGLSPAQLQVRKKQKKQNGSDVTKRLSILSSRPASSPQNPPDWFYRVWTTHGSKSTSLLLAQRKQALHTNATSSASVWSSWKEGTCRLRRIEQQVLLSDSAGIQKNTHTHTHTRLCKCRKHTLWHPPSSKLKLFSWACFPQCVSAFLLFRNNYLRCGGDHQTGPGHRHTPPPPSHRQNNPSTYLHRRDEATASPAGHYLTPRVTRWVITAFSYLPAYCLIIEEECVCVCVCECVRDSLFSNAGLTGRQADIA